MYYFTDIQIGLAFIAGSIFFVKAASVGHSDRNFPNPSDDLTTRRHSIFFEELRLVDGDKYRFGVGCVEATGALKSFLLQWGE